MFDVPVNYWAVIIAAVVNFIIGFLWFGPVFGKQWMKAAGIQAPPVMDAAVKKMMMKSMVITFIGSVLMACTLSHAITFVSAYLNIYGVYAGFTTAFWTWLGFVVPITVGVVLWDNKSWKYWFITYSYYLVGFLVMGAILSVWL